MRVYSQIFFSFWLYTHTICICGYTDDDDDDKKDSVVIIAVIQDRSFFFFSYCIQWFDLKGYFFRSNKSFIYLSIKNYFLANKSRISFKTASSSFASFNSVPCCDCWSCSCSSRFLFAANLCILFIDLIIKNKTNATISK